MDVPRQRRSKWLKSLLVAIGVGGVVVAALLMPLPRHSGPTAQRASLWLGTVERGDMPRTVRGSGRLAPRRVRWITAVAPGRVERLLVDVGDTVAENAPLLELSNPDLEVRALEASGQLTDARARLAQLSGVLESGRLEQQSRISELRTAHLDAARRTEANEELRKDGMVPALEYAQAQDVERDLAARVGNERRRMNALDRVGRRQLAAERQRIDDLRKIAAFRARQVTDLTVRSRQPGVVHELNVELGQWVTPGTTLGKVAQTDELEAELELSERVAREIAPGQTAHVDTGSGTLRGKVVHVDPTVVEGAVKVTVAFDEPPPSDLRPDQSVVGTVELEVLQGVVYLPRPQTAREGATARLFRLTSAARAVGVDVAFGRASSRFIEVRSGLAPGDQVILSDNPDWADAQQLSIE